MAVVSLNEIGKITPKEIYLGLDCNNKNIDLLIDSIIVYN